MERIWNIRSMEGSDLIVKAETVEKAFEIARQVFKDGRLDAWELTWMDNILGSNKRGVYQDFKP